MVLFPVIDIFIGLIINIIEHITKVKFHLSFLIVNGLILKLIIKEIKKNNPEINKVVDKRIVPI